jgi:hypothetical protein
MSFDSPSIQKMSFDNPSIQPTKAKRKRISTHQYNRLIEIFQQTDTPSSVMRESLADELNMTKREVQVNHILFFFLIKVC